MLKLFWVSLLCSLICSVKAQIVTDRPDQTESSLTVGQGDLQIESGVLVGYEGEGKYQSRQLLAPTSLFRFGLLKGVEFRVLSQFEVASFKGYDSDGISDLELGTKIQLLNKENVNTQIAVLSHLVLPTGSSVLSGDVYSSINKLCLSHMLSDGLNLGYNVGYNYFGKGNGNLSYSISLNSAVNDKVAVYIEPYGEWIEMEDLIVNIDAGFTYLANDNLQFDLSFGTGVNEKMNYISAGLSWLLQKGE